MYFISIKFELNFAGFPLIRYIACLYFLFPQTLLLENAFVSLENTFVH